MPTDSGFAPVDVIAANPPPLEVHAVSHTHWDREWYHDAARFRQRLVPLVDALLDYPSDGAAFLLDGQAILLSDYLAVRPERRETLVAHLTSRALEAGPWYVLADNLIPGGEAIIRNLEAGRRLLARLGATAPRVAYCPDTFGHPAMMPAIAVGFGLPVAIVWRGLGGVAHPRADALRWRAPDGSQVVLYHLPRDGYEGGSALPTDPQGARLRWAQLAEEWRSRNRTGVVLLPNGADHHARQPRRAEAIRALDVAARSDHSQLVPSGLSQFAAALLEAAATSELPLVEGELRDSYGYTWTLQGTFATRSAQKRTNARLERGLLRDVEPWLALAWLHGAPETHVASADGRLTLAQLPTLLAQAWETLLRTHPHDTLCGCSTDAVALAMDARQRAVATQLVGAREAALQLVLSHDPAAARDHPPLLHPPVVVRNRAGRARGGIAELRLVETIVDVSVGPGSANPAVPLARAEALLPAATPFPIQAGRVRLAHARRESPQHYPDDDLVRVHHVVAWVPAIPAHGIRVLTLNEGECSGGAVPDVTRQPSPAPALSLSLSPAPSPSQPVTLTHIASGVILDNGLVRVRCDADGVELHVGTRVLARALTLESQTDGGDTYTTSLRGAPHALQLMTIHAGACGPLRASVRLRWVLPAGVAPLSEDAIRSDIGAMRVDDPAPLRNRGRVVVDTELVLDADAPYLRCDVRGVNDRRNHRLRLCLNSEISGGTTYADAAFGPVLRTPIVQTVESQRAEVAPPTMPMHRWVALCDDTRGATLVSDGLAESEVSNGRIAITLLRAVGELSRADLPERPGHAGWPCATPRAQSPGRFQARLGVLLHEPWSTTTLERIEDACDALLLPLVGESWRDYRGPVGAFAGPALVGVGLRASAVTLSRDGTAVLLRVTNTSESSSVGTWHMPTAGPWRVTPCRLDETALGPESIIDHEIPLSVPPRGLVTLRVTRG